MPDLPTALTTLAAAVGGKDMLTKVLGPTADYLGGALKNWTEHRLANLAAIFKAASAKLPANSGHEAVPPRVLAGVLSDGSLSTNALMAEYFGGVLASSRSGIARDDRGALFTSLLSRLSVYQIRAHYVLYSTLRATRVGSEHSVMEDSGRVFLSILIGGAELVDAMAFEPGEDPRILVMHSLLGLHREQLINDVVRSGHRYARRGVDPSVVDTGLIYGPSYLGVELFLWAHGLGREPPSRFLAKDLTIKPIVGFPNEWHGHAVEGPPRWRVVEDARARANSKRGGNRG